MLKLSLIVPVYNVERYLVKCLNSLLGQDIATDDYEIIVVNDGSTDSSADIAEQFAEKYPNIQSIHQKNRGLGGARNTGIQYANGKYIQFVDSDDYLAPNVLAGLLRKMDDEELDILRFKYQNVNEKGDILSSRKGKQFVDYRDEVCDGMHFLANRLGYACYAWQFIIKTALLKNPENRFCEGIYFEDTEWTPRILIQAKRVTSIDKIVYNYLVREGSITKSVSEENKRKWVNDKMLIVDGLLKIEKNAKKKDWYNGMIALTVSSILTYLSFHFYNERKLYVTTLKQLGVFPLSIEKTNNKTKFRLALINFSPLIYCWFIRRNNKK